MDKLDGDEKSHYSLSIRLRNGFFLNQYPPSPLKSKDLSYKKIAPSEDSLEDTLV